MNNIIDQLKEHLSIDVYNKYAVVLPEGYLQKYELPEIVNDCQMMAELTLHNEYAISIRAGETAEENVRANIWQIKLLRLDDMISLSRGLPIIENFGFKLLDEEPFKINISPKDHIYICDFGVVVPDGLVDKINDKVIINNLKNAIVAAFTRQIESDSLNQLILHAGLTARQISLIRAVVKYVVQTNLPFSAGYISDCLIKYAEVSKNLFELFAATFSLEQQAADSTTLIHNKIHTQLDKVENLAEDQILTTVLSVINAMVRTNYYQTANDGASKPYIAFKLESAKVLNLPKPYPLYEVFVYSIRFEAIHLRGGKVSRGGLRWSDRHEDFRTEVLGLVKAQMVKNSVIIPTGSKGGFVCKKLPDIQDREAYISEGISCYKQFIAGLLDITDNLVADQIVYPKQLVRLDDDDPYLVVAADKGTATFSDYANEMAQEYGFWLGDAFASGGSAGYDHKKMGITAKGAWEAIKRHFRHLGVDTQSQDFTVIGIGDLMGDVFGNGMLLSPHIKLIAAFNHMNIFLDPNPDPTLSFAERARIFNLQRSTWNDYDRSKISPGGGVYSCFSKTIPLSAEVRQWLGVNFTELSPTELIHLILQAPADLLYNGGIGTYIKAEAQSNDEVKDKANDAVRINASQLRVKVIAEGGNLGLTQLARVEFAKLGGSICTDAIDNSAGVDCSDHEVNIKILFAAIMSKTGMSIQERNKILESMTDDIAQLVLRDNYLQTLVLRTAGYRARYTLPNHQIFIRKLENSGELDRALEFLPTDAEISERMQGDAGLTSPEMAVLLAYSKVSLKSELLKSPVVTDTDFNELLVDYFPAYLQKNYREFILEHYLRKEIIANQLANLIVNRAGITFMSRFTDEFSLPSESIVKAWWVAYNLLDANNLYGQIEALDNKVPAEIQLKLFVMIEKAVERLCRWILRYVKEIDNAQSLIDRFKGHITVLEQNIATLIKNEEYPEVQEEETLYLTNGIPEALAILISRFSYLPQVMDIVLLASENALDYELVAANYFVAGRLLKVDWLRKNVLFLPRENKWQALARSALLADVSKLYREIMIMAIQFYQGDTVAWISANEDKMTKIRTIWEELQTYKVLDLAMLSAVIREFVKIIDLE